MTERTTTEMYWGRGSVGNHHWVSGQAYPTIRHYATHRVMDFCVDASAVYRAPGPGSSQQVSESWGVLIKDSAEGELSHFDVPIPPHQTSDERYDYLAGAIESYLGRTGLAILLY